MNIRKVIDKLTAIAEEITKNTEGVINGYEAPVEFVSRKYDEFIADFVTDHRCIIRIGYDPEGYEWTPVYITDIPAPRTDSPESVTAEREAGRARARMLLCGETVFGNTTLHD